MFFIYNFRYFCLMMSKLSDLNIKTNFVLIKPEKDIEELKSGLLVKAGKEDKQRQLANTEARHYNITGEVLAVPDSLVFRGEQVNQLRNNTGGKFNDDDLKLLHNLVNGSMEYKTKIEVAVGDKVWFDYLAHINANTENRIVEVDGYGDCILVEYSRLFIRERDNDKVPLNGWIFIKKSLGTREVSKQFVLSDNADISLKNVAEVVQVGSPIKEYLSARYTDFYFKDIKVGAKIIYNERLATPLEYSLHESEGLEKLYKIRRTDIKAIILENGFALDAKDNTNFKIEI